jgi:hypothetical protein
MTSVPIQSKTLIAGWRSYLGVSYLRLGGRGRPTQAPGKLGEQPVSGAANQSVAMCHAWPVRGQACETVRRPPDTSNKAHDPSPLRAASTPSHSVPLFRPPSNYGALPPRRALLKTAFPPPREFFALVFPTFRFFKTWVLRSPRAQKHPGTQPSIPPHKLHQTPKNLTFAPPDSLFSPLVLLPQNRAERVSAPSRNPFARTAQQNPVH